jgi:hypothetical protein
MVVAVTSHLAKSDLLDVPSSVQMMVFIGNSGDFSSYRPTYPAVWWWLTEQFHHSAQVLQLGCQQELIMCTAHAAQAKAVQF